MYIRQHGARYYITVLSVSLQTTLHHSLPYVSMDRTVLVSRCYHPLRSNSHFPGEPGLPWCLLELRTMQVVVTTAAIRRAKLQSNHHQQTNIQLFTGRMSFLSSNQQCQSTESNVTLLLYLTVITITCYIYVFCPDRHPSAANETVTTGQLQ